MADETFSFRWGIPLLDDGHTTIPNFVLDNYALAGVTRSEFLVIVHLARYQFERPGAQCKPSVATVARQMGYTKRGLQKVLAGLEERGLLARQYRPSETTIYNFRGFSRAVLAVKLSTGDEPQFIPKKLKDEPQFTPGVNYSSPKEENIRSNNDDDKEENIRSNNDDDNGNPHGGLLAHVVALYAVEVGRVTPRVEKRLQVLVKQYPDPRRWEAAFDGVVKSGVRRLDYLTKCLQNVGKLHFAKPK